MTTPLDIAATGLPTPEPEILPCPFPHTRERQALDVLHVGGDHWVACRTCFAYGPSAPSVADAIAAWNAPTLLAREQQVPVPADSLSTTDPNDVEPVIR